MQGTSLRVGGLSSFFLTAMLALGLNACGASFCISTGFPPTITAFSPATVVAGGGAVRVTINGSNFGSNAVVVLPDGTQLQPVFVSSSQVVVMIPANVIVTQGTLVFFVSNPCTGFSNNVAIAVGF